ncbi:unnamed protein product [Adineta ricciae]|uniref:Uncharacterized protein n=1 Tax=Adineta ricciae TaxID=249248 RepID=A0A814FV44_ADIRI|nr:unnamed protein product [Adineta ricciae]
MEKNTQDCWLGPKCVSCDQLEKQLLKMTEPCSNIMSPDTIATTTTQPQVPSMCSNQSSTIEYHRRCRAPARSQRNIIHCVFCPFASNSSARYTNCILDDSYYHLLTRSLPKSPSTSTLHIKVMSNPTAAERRTRYNLSVTANSSANRPKSAPVPHSGQPTPRSRSLHTTTSACKAKTF